MVPFSPPNPWESLIFFTVPIVLPFPESYVVGITWYVAFQIDFFPLAI